MPAERYLDADFYDVVKDEWAEQINPLTFPEFLRERLRTEASLAQTAVPSAPLSEAEAASALLPHAASAQEPLSKAA